MESWKSGSEHLLEELEKACNRIGQDIAAELDDAKFVRVNREELRLLRETSSKTEKYAERIAQLTDDLEECREAAKGVDGLEKENQRLAAELQHQLQKQYHDTPIAPRKPSPAPEPKDKGQSVEPASSAMSFTVDESQPIDLEKYRTLVSKLNRTQQAYLDSKEVMFHFKEEKRAAEEKCKKWQFYADLETKRRAKREDKIKALEARIQELEGRSKTIDGAASKALVDEEEPSAPLLDGEVPSFSEPESSFAVPPSPVAISPRNKLIDNAVMEFPARDRGRGILKDAELSRKIELEVEDEEVVDLPPHRHQEITEVEETDHESIGQHHSSSTQDDPDPLTPRKVSSKEQTTAEEIPPSSPDSPIFVEARSVRKPKTRRKAADSGPVSKVKIELLSSSPIGLPALHYMNLNESLDLDNIGEKVNTPRKQRRLLQPPCTTSQESSQSLYPSRNTNQHRNTTTNPQVPLTRQQETPVRRTGSALQPLSVNKPILPRTSDGKSSKRRRVASDEAVGELMEDGEMSTDERPLKRRLGNEGLGPLDDLLSKPSPLRNVLSLVHLGQRSRASPAKKPRSSLIRPVNNGPRVSAPASHAARSIPAIEYGKLLSKAEVARKQHAAQHAAQQIGSTTPRNLKEVPRSSDPSTPSSKGTSRGSIEPSRPSSRSSATSIAQSEGPSRSSIILPPKRNPLQLSGQRETPENSTRFATPQSRGVAESGWPTSRQSGRPSINGPSKKQQPRAEMTEREWELDPEQEPLRQRPVATLKLSDFKVNPKRNQGMDYAFSEVVRGRGARACLQGCTKPECCGPKFRGLAEITRSGQFRTSSQEERDEELLKDFLGDDYYKRRNMSKDEREEVIKQALTRQLANKHGKHRHAYARPASPEGFWRADFPTTQEDAADRARAKEKEREMIIQRRQEAMRPNGAYIFRDE